MKKAAASTDDDSDSSQHSMPPRQASPDVSSSVTSSLGKAMNDDQRRLYETKLALARTAGKLNANLKAEIQVYEGKRDMDQKMNRLRRADQSQHDLVLGESALEVINLFKSKAEESRQKIHQLKQEVLNAQALTEKYKELYERTRKQQGRDPEEVDDDSVSRTLSNAARSYNSDASSNTANLSIANLRKRSINFELEYERLQIKHQALLHENEKLKGEVQRLKTDNQQLISKVKRADDDQREALNKYNASERVRLDLEKRLEREKKQHQMLLQTVRKQTAEWLVEQRQQQQMDEEDKWNSIIPAEDRHALRAKDRSSHENQAAPPAPAPNAQINGNGSVISRATGVSNRGSEKSNLSRSNTHIGVAQRKA